MAPSGADDTDRPCSIRILGKEHTIHWDPKPATIDDFGEQNDLTNVIRVCSGLPTDEERETLLHELLHAIDGTLGFDRPEREHHIRSVAIFEMFRNNKGLAKFLFRDAA